MISYIGGKARLSSWIISSFPKEYTTYCEVFGGGGWVLFKKPKGKSEIYNDLNENLYVLFKQIRDNYNEFKFKSEWVLHSRKEFDVAKKALNSSESISELDRAVYTAILYSMSYSGKGSSYGYGVENPGKKWTIFLRRIEKIRERLEHVQIENLDFETFIKKYDREGSLFYVDPPYWGCENYYNNAKVSFTKADHKRLFDVLNSIAGRFVISYEDNPELRELYSGYRFCERVAVRSCVNTAKADIAVQRPKATEVLIINY